MVLKREFDRNPYLIGKERKELAKRLDLTETQVSYRFGVCLEFKFNFLG